MHKIDPHFLLFLLLGVVSVLHMDMKNVIYMCEFYICKIYLYETQCHVFLEAPFSPELELQKIKGERIGYCDLS